MNTISTDYDEFRRMIETIERMRKRGYGFSCTDLTMDSGREWWSVHFTGARDSCSAQAETLAKAVVKAALKWQQNTSREWLRHA